MSYKSISYAIATAAALLLSKPVQAATLLPYLQPVRDEINNQLASAGDTPADRKLVNSLKAALKQIDKPGQASLANDTRLLSTLASALTRTSASDNFVPLLETARDNYIAALNNEATSSSDRLNGALPSKTQSAADKALSAIFTLLEQAGTNPDLKVSTRLLAKVPAKLVAADRLISRALAVQTSTSTSSAAGITAKISGAINYNFKSRKAVVQGTSDSGLTITGGTGSAQTAYAVLLTMSNLQAGDNTITVGTGLNGDGWVIFAKGTSTDNGIAFMGTSGTIHVNYNPSSKTVKGTFSASCAHNEDSSTVDITGSFNARIP
jgi:hypothetical protein